ncbi:hypothetical protein DS745_03140 [Anaerobacillus alkaliphilus]|uniref:Uncharacterized protein n=1 Tax=Anaerobacillus alkaliphilus TaxID=1548597 RepID=A0A4Q0VXI6_9BACI|nr:hypothetical protein [Anaerobacillus alkaliphilus]RXJ04394.1 hypothetical protein DS745_03140 [Anaerobacillus alkaliphilus]
MINRNKSKRNWYIVGVVTMLLGGIWLFFHFTYFFNPLTFKKDDVTYLPWSWYENPLTIEYMVLEDEGWQGKIVDDGSEVKFVIDQLKSSPVIQDADREEYQTSDNIIRLIVLRRGDDAILLEVRQEWEGNVFYFTHNRVFVKVTEELEMLFEERFSQVEKLH